MQFSLGFILVKMSTPSKPYHSIFSYLNSGSLFSFKLRAKFSLVSIMSHKEIQTFVCGVFLQFFFSVNEKEKIIFLLFVFCLQVPFSTHYFFCQIGCKLYVWWNALKNFGFSNFQNHNVFLLSWHPCYLSACTVLITMLYYIPLPLIFRNNVWNVLCMWSDCSTMFIYMCYYFEKVHQIWIHFNLGWLWKACFLLMFCCAMYYDAWFSFSLRCMIVMTRFKMTWLDWPKHYFLLYFFLVVDYIRRVI